jgi:hypothetical protein
MTYFFPSRLQRKESTRRLRQAVFFTFLSLFLFVLLIFLGIPALTYLAVLIGNFKNATTPVETGHLLPPPPPHLQPLPEATNSAQINLAGFAQPGNTIKFYLSGTLQNEVVAENDGSFSFLQIKLTQGTNDIFVQAASQDGATSQPSGHLRIELDQQPPSLTIDEPADQSIFSYRQDTVNFKGQTEANVTLLINDHVAVLDQNYRFNYPFPLKNGENKIILLATDQAGNRTEKNLTLTRQ